MSNAHELDRNERLFSEIPYLRPSKTAIFPKKQGRKREISNESARGWSLREANV